MTTYFEENLPTAISYRQIDFTKYLGLLLSLSYLHTLAVVYLYIPVSLNNIGSFSSLGGSFRFEKI
jgi:hypothetical protein